MDRIVNKDLPVKVWRLKTDSGRQKAAANTNTRHEHSSHSNG